MYDRYGKQGLEQGGDDFGAGAHDFFGTSDSIPHVLPVSAYFDPHFWSALCMGASHRHKNHICIVAICTRYRHAMILTWLTHMVIVCAIGYRWWVRTPRSRIYGPVRNVWPDLQQHGARWFPQSVLQSHELRHARSVGWDKIALYAQLRIHVQPSYNAWSYDIAWVCLGFCSLSYLTSVSRNVT